MKLINIFNNLINEQLVLDIMKNTEAAPYLGSRFGQDVEPKGTYVLQGSTKLDNWLNGKAVLKNPLYINVDSNTLVSYKRDLSNKYKAKGKKLSDKIMRDGYDAIITVYPNGEYGEIVLLPNANFILN